MPRALFCACNSWLNHGRVGSHHLARCLARRGWKVAFVSDPVSPLHIAGGIHQELKARIRLYRDRGRWLESNIWTWLPAALLTPQNYPLLRAPWLARHWHSLCMPSIRCTLAKVGFTQFDLVYVDSLKQAYWWQNIPHKKVIFRLADRLDGFANFSRSSQSVLLELSAEVDLVAYTTSYLKEYVDTLPAKQTLLLPNGVDYAHFATPAPPPPEYIETGRPRIIYVGVMAEWFNREWVEYAATKMSECDFFLIGPQSADHVKGFSRKFLKNIHHLGPRPFELLPGYLQHADVGIIPFDYQNHPTLVGCINPLKLYEYLATGLPVVSSRWPTVESINSPAMLVDSVQSFVQAIEDVIAWPKDERAQRQTSAQDFARAHSWEQTVEKLLRVVFDTHE